MMVHQSEVRLYSFAAQKALKKKLLREGRHQRASLSLEKRERLFWPEKLRPDNEMLSEARKFVHRTYYYNVVSYIHIPLVL